MVGHISISGLTSIAHLLSVSLHSNHAVLAAAGIASSGIFESSEQLAIA